MRQTRPELRLYLPVRHRIEMRARAALDPGALASLYLIGFEDHPDDSGEITVMEIFGHEVGAAGTVVRRGVKAINDPRLKTEILRIHCRSARTTGTSMSPTGRPRESPSRSTAVRSAASPHRQPIRCS